METMAYMLNISKTSISHWVNRRATPRPRMATKIAKLTKNEVPCSFWGYKKDRHGKLFSIASYTRKKRAKRKKKEVE